MAEIILHTREPQQPGFDPLAKTPYERVLAVTQAGNTSWDRNLINRPGSIEVVEHAFEVPERFARRTASFVDQILGHPDVNCHVFAGYIAGDEAAPNSAAATLRATDIMIDGAETNELPAIGQQVVIGKVTRFHGLRIRTSPEHSFVKLDATHCLQVTHLRGFLALANCNELLEWYEVNPGNTNRHLYVRKPSPPTA